MSNIKFQLSLNKHPKDCEDYSLVSAKNIRVSDDFSCLQSEESIISHSTINNYLEENNYKIFGVIPCNKELILFAGEESSSAINILRYNEDNDLIIKSYKSLSYYGGKFIGTFTYNINKELIIAFSEYDGTEDVPLKTINLGVWSGENTTSEELDFEDSKLPNNPAIRIPRIASFDYVPGTSYKGWYYYFIRYKINSNDYTRWFPIGFPIFTTTLELKNIFKYGLNNGIQRDDKITDSFILNGISDHFASKDDISNESIKITITALDERYKQFQIGFCCISKTYSKAFRTSDIDIPIIKLIGAKPKYEYITNISSCLEYTVNDLILNSYNYYNVKNIINYKNRLYISNYKENSLPTISQEDLNKIRLRLRKEDIEFDDIKYKDLLTNVENNYDIQKYTIYKNPALYIANKTIILKTGEQLDSDSLEFNNSYIVVMTGSEFIKIYPEYEINTKHRGDSIPIILTFRIGHKTYSCDISVNTSTKITTIVNADSFNDDITFSTQFQYINTNNSFKDRKTKSTLLPGEIYNFYIHFVNSFGESTPGYRIPNTVKFKIENSDNEYIPIKIDNSKYLLVKLNQDIFDLSEENIVVDEDDRIANANSVTYDLETNTYTFSSAIYDADEIENIMKNLIADYNIYKIKNNLTWDDLFATDLFENGNEGTFSYYENNNGNSLFKVPDAKFLYDSNTNTIKTTIFSLKYDLSNFDIPEGYNGFYFSYEKFEKQNKVDGILTKFDVFNQNSEGALYKKYNDENGDEIDNVNFYSSELDIADDLELDYNILRISNTIHLNHSVSTLVHKVEKIDLSSNYPINYNDTELPYELRIDLEDYTIYPYMYCSIENIKLRKGNKISDGKFGIGTSLNIKLATNKPNKINEVFNANTSLNIVKASLIKINKDIYTNENKVLIKFTNVYYRTNGTSFNPKIGIINQGLNGHITYQGTLIYNYNKFIMSAENAILTEQYIPYYRCPIYKGLYAKRLLEDRPPIAYIQQICFSDIFYEAKSFKNEPETLFMNLEEIKANEEQLMSFAANNIITPANSIDLFQNLQTNQDKLNPKTYLAKNDNQTYITKFDKRIQRSNVISDESLANSWRKFPLEGYKDISENKGSITNLIGIGTTLLVHTEHSLFAFDGSNTLKTGDDNDIRLTLPDVFDIEYVEVFTSDLGVCGLQDKEAYIVGQFGYIFYDNDAHRFYKYAFKKIEIIDFDIVQFLNFGIPYEVRFAHDIERNRLLINFKIHYNNEDLRYTLSYNHQLNKFISLHTYNFDKAVNTKIISYLINDNKIYCDAHDLNSINYKLQRRVFTDIDSLYGKYDNGISNSPSISIIVNTDYEVMKTIEFITYKLFKRASSYSKEDYNIVNEREVSKVPYSGYKLRIHNDMCDSGLIDVSVDNEYNKNIFNNYKKPWWEFGNWNFNYFRNKKKDKTLHDIMSRIYGNYFVIDIIFYDDNNPYNQKIEFENLTAQIIADQTV